MAQVIGSQANSFEGRVGVLSVEVTELAQNATADILLPIGSGRRFVAMLLDSNNKVIPTSSSTQTITYTAEVYDSVNDEVTSQGKITLTNANASAFTGVLQVMVLA